MAERFGDDDRHRGDALIRWVTDVGISGFGMLPPAKEVAFNHLESSKNIEAAIKSIIAWRTTYAAGTGFITGMGGIAAMPITIPASLATSYALGANTAAAIASMKGYDIHSDKVRTMILLCLIGEAGEEILRSAGIAVSTKMLANVFSKIPGKVLIEINKKVGFRLVTKAGEKGVVNLMKIVPVAGGVVGAAFDGAFVNACGKTAQRIFK